MISAWWLLPVFVVGALMGCVLMALAAAATKRDEQEMKYAGGEDK